MPQNNLGFQLSEDRGTLTISVLEDQRRLGYVTASAPEVEHLIRMLAEYRRHMFPEVQRTLPKGQAPQGEGDPIWAVPSHPKAPDKVLMIRHFGIGWLSFFLPGASAQKLADALLGQTQPETIVQPDRTGRPN